MYRSLLIITILISCNMANDNKIRLLDKRELMNFPSASAIDFYNDKLYVTGDDARNMIVLDKSYTVLDSISLFPGTSLRIPKKEKNDLEASTIFQYNNKAYLLVSGSGSTKEREVFFLFPLDSPVTYDRIDAHAFWQSLRTHGLDSVNIEGLATMDDKIIFANRAHRRQPHNHFIVLKDIALLDSAGNASPHILHLELPNEEQIIKGVSGLVYEPSLDLLLFTASVEETDNAIEDGTIGDSFLGYVKNFSAKAKDKTVAADALLNLPAIHPDFDGEKIESVCVESAGGDELILHLVADNDDGTSTLFKISLRLK